MHGGDGAVPGQAEAEHLHHAVHRIGGEHAGAGAAAGAGVVLDILKRRVVDLSRAALSDTLKDAVKVKGASVVLSGHHRPAGDHYRGQIELRRRHRHSWDDLVAVRYQHEAVERVGARHDFDRVHDQFAAWQREFHSLMVHRDAVADANNGEFYRQAAGGVDAGLDRLRYRAQMHVAGNDGVIGVRHADPRTLYLPVGVAGRLQQ